MVKLNGLFISIAMTTGFVGCQTLSASLSESKSPATPAGLSNSSELSSFKALLDQSFMILQSDDFRSNLLAIGATYPDLHVHYLGDAAPGSNKTSVTQTPKELLSAVRGQSNYRYISSPAYLSGGLTERVAQAGWTGASDQSGSMTIGRFHLARWQSIDLVKQSCAVNTVAHETSHLISSNSSLFLGHLTDNNAQTLTSFDEQGQAISPPRAVASYLVGTVAQCTWLQQQGYSPTVEIEKCVEVFGHRGFNSDRCNQFQGSQAIEYDVRLAAEHVITD